MREREGMGEGRERKGRMDEGEEEREWRKMPVGCFLQCGHTLMLLLIARTKFSDFSNQRHYH